MVEIHLLEYDVALISGKRYQGRECLTLIKKLREKYPESYKQLMLYGYCKFEK